MLIADLAFNPNPQGHGGERRSSQIAGLLRRSGLPIKQKRPVNLEYPPRGLGSKIRGIMNSVRAGEGLTNRTNFIRVAKDFYSFEGEFGSKLSGVYVWEPKTHQDYHIPFMARRAGLKIVAVPQNLESLVPEQCSQRSGRQSPDWFDEELRTLAKCDRVFSISREEQWLLRLHGIAAEYLPYSPDGEVHNSLRRVREARETGSVSQRKAFLLLGTYANNPTRLGMLDLIRGLIDVKEKVGNSIVLHIAGFGTDRISAELSIPEFIVLHGGVSQGSLEALLTEVTAVIAHQHITTGCLTRIPEMLIAGIPVFCNTNAVRSWHNTPGVSIYDSVEELLVLFRTEQGVPEIPQNHGSHSDRFLMALTELHGSHVTT